MPTTNTGGCLCGAVRYEVNAEPLAVLCCHCTDCQKVSGGPYATAVLVPKRAITINGTTKAFAVKGESGYTVTRRFCPECGTPLFSELSAHPDLFAIKQGSLDERSTTRPTMNIWTSSAQPWVHLDASIPQFPKNPPVG